MTHFTHIYAVSLPTIPGSFRAVGVMSLCNFAISGTDRYLNTRYPAAFSNEALNSSCFSLFACVESSNSITAIPSNSELQITKSAYFRSNLFLVDLSPASISALNDTCAKIISSGNAFLNCSNIGFSRLDKIFRFFVKMVVDFDATFFAFADFNNLIKIKNTINTTATTKAMLNIFSLLKCDYFTTGGYVKQKDDLYTSEMFQERRPGRPRKPDAKSAAQRAKEYRARAKQRKFDFLRNEGQL